MRHYLALMASSFAVVACVAPQARVGGTNHVTVPLFVEGNRPFVDVSFRRPDGSMRSARFLVDTGGGGFLIVESLARDLGLKWGKAMLEEGRKFARAKVRPTAFVGGFPLALDADRVLVLVGTDNMLPSGAPGHADGLLPGHVLARYHVVFDYPSATFTLAQPGTVEPVRWPATSSSVSASNSTTRTKRCSSRHNDVRQTTAHS